MTALQISAQKDKKTDTALETAIKLGNHDEEFQDTLNLLDEIRFDIGHFLLPEQRPNGVGEAEDNHQREKPRSG